MGTHCLGLFSCLRKELGVYGIAAGTNRAVNEDWNRKQVLNLWNRTLSSNKGHKGRKDLLENVKKIHLTLDG